jgi:DNA repair protein RecO (recombination protein O)
MAPRNYQTKAIIVKKTKLGEADRILTLYTPDLGKIQAVAKGVRRPRSKMAGHLELMTCSQISLARGRNLDTITGAQTIESFLPLKTDLVLASYGFYVIELVNQFTPDQSGDEDIYNLLLETLINLQNSDNRELLIRYFELKLLELAGYRPQLHNCIACDEPLAPVINYFNAGAGGMLCPRCALKYTFSLEVSVNALKVLRFIQDNTYNAVSRLRINSGLAQELEVVIRHYLRYILEREVKSASWLDTLRDQLKQPGTPTPITTEIE